MWSGHKGYSLCFHLTDTHSHSSFEILMNKYMEMPTRVRVVRNSLRSLKEEKVSMMLNWGRMVGWRRFFFLSTFQLLGCLELPLLGFSSWLPSDRLSNCFFCLQKGHKSCIDRSKSSVHFRCIKTSVANYLCKIL